MHHSFPGWSEPEDHDPTIYRPDDVGSGYPAVSPLGWQSRLRGRLRLTKLHLTSVRLKLQISFLSSVLNHNCSPCDAGRRRCMARMQLLVSELLNARTPARPGSRASLLRVVCGGIASDSPPGPPPASRRTARNVQSRNALKNTVHVSSTACW
jgi:hypothetical protein